MMFSFPGGCRTKTGTDNYNPRRLIPYLFAFQPRLKRRMSIAPSHHRTIRNKKERYPRTLSSFIKLLNHPNGLSPKGLLNESPFPLLPPPLGGGFGGVAVIITRDIELSKVMRVISGFIYCFLNLIIYPEPQDLKYRTKIVFYQSITNMIWASGIRRLAPGRIFFLPDA
jgi:hypothetical protein